MNPILHLLILLQILLSSASVFFHELSHVVLKPGGTGGHATFGFSLGYQNGKPPNLITGAPNSSFTGKVYRCPFSEVLTNKKIVCQDLGIDVEKLAPYIRENAKDITLNLGYSISAAQDYFFTCAPRWSATTKRYNTSLFGTCFVHNDTTRKTHRYDGIFEQYSNLKYEDKVLDRIKGGNGWRTLMDTENDLLIIAKLAIRPDFTYVAASSPLEPVRSMMTGAKVDSSQKRNAKRFIGYRNMGFSLAAGKFFDSRTMYYALSSTGPIGAGVIHFLYSRMSASQKARKLTILLEGGTPVSIEDSTVGSMFGAAMSSADVDRDGLAELLVGAPAQGNDEGGYEAGAVHIYLGGDYQDINANTRHRVLLGAKPKSRFGTSIAASDIDGDKLPEIFIGAPFEDLGDGALYIVSGFEINNKLMKTRGFKDISVSQLKLTQIIRNRDFETFGYSLQVVPDIDGNGCDELAVGSPGSEKIMFLRCMPAVKVIINAEYAGDQAVREQDNSFSVLVCVNVFNIQETEYSAEFTVTNEVIGNGAYIDDHLMTYKFGLHGNMTAANCTSVVVNLRDNEPGAYILYSKVVMDEESILNSKDFNSSWAMLSPESDMETSVEVSRHCLGKDCEPDLSMSITWTGGNSSTYQLGSSETLTAKLRVRNVGSSSWEACALVRLAGAPVAKFGCVGQGDGSYKCPMPTPLRRNAEYEIDIKFNMSQPTNLDKELKVNVVLRDFCYKSNVTEEKNMTISLQLRTDDVFLEGSTYNQNVSDAEIRDQKTPNVNDAHTYSITNAGSVTWKDVRAVVSIDKKPYIDENSYRVSSVVSRCDRKELTHRYIFTCTLELLPRTTVKIFASTNIIKNQIIDNLVEGSLNVTSAFILYLEPTSEEKNMRLSTIISLRKELSLAQNKNLIIFLAILGAIVALAVLIFILYKMRFFKREEKTKLETLKQNHIRRQSVKRSMSTSQDREQIIDDNMDIEVDDDDPFETVDMTEPVLKHHQNTPNETESPR